MKPAKRILIVTAILLVGTASTFSATFGIGFSGGGTIPFSQSDQSKGETFSIRLLLKLSSNTGIEPRISYSQLGYGHRDILLSSLSSHGTRYTGAKINSLGVDLTFGTDKEISNLQMFFALGLAYYRLDQVNPYDESDLDLDTIGSSAGFGMRIGIVRQLELEGRTGLTLILADSFTIRPLATFTAGLNYYFGEKQTERFTRSK